MARRYVRDKIGRFSAKGGGGKRAGKQSKSTAGRSARAAYHDAKSGLRFEKRLGSPGGTGTKNTRAIRKSQKKLTTLSNQMTGKGKAAGSGLKKGLRSQTASRRKQSFRSKATKGRTARAAYKKASSVDRKGRTDTGRKKVIKKQTGKPAYRSNTGFNSPQRTKQPRAGSKTKTQKIRAKIDRKKFANKELRGSEFKGAKKRAATKKKAATKKTAATKAPSSFGGTKKYSRQGKVSKASQGSGAKDKYKKATSELRQKKWAKAEHIKGRNRLAADPKNKHLKIVSAAKIGKVYDKSISRKKAQVTRVTNKLTAKGAAKAKNKKTMGKKLTKSELRMASMRRKDRLGARPKKKLTGKTAPKKGETAKQYRSRMSRSGPDSVQRSLYFKKRDGSRQEKQSGYLRKPGYPGISGGESRETAKSKRRAKTRDTWGDGTGGNKRSAAITKSKERHAYKMKKRKLAAQKKAVNQKIKGRKG